MNRWGMYELLKGNNLTIENILKIESMNATEVKEGIIEYLITNMRSKDSRDQLQRVSGEDWMRKG